MVYCRPFKRALTTNSTATTFASKIPTITEPTNDGVIDLAPGGGQVPEKMIVIPFGIADDNDVFDLRIIGWRHVGAGPAIWIPTILGQFTCTLSAAVGVAGAPVLNTEHFADTITVATQGKYTDTDSGGAASHGSIEITSPTGDLIAHLVMDLKGSEKVEFSFDATTGDPTSMNCLISFV